MKELSEVKKILSELSVDAILFTDCANMRYFAGFTGEGYVYISGDKVKSFFVVNDKF